MSRQRRFTNGDKAWMLTVVRSYDPSDPKRTVVRCDCGIERSISAGLFGRARSCGCLSTKMRNAEPSRDKTTGKWPSTYNTWIAMRQRCRDPLHDSWPHYGGRGVSVCERWEHYDTFVADMGKRPSGTTIDRIDVNGHYEPGNCRWATPKMQAGNRRPRADAVYIDGMTYREAMAAYGISRAGAYERRNAPIRREKRLKRRNEAKADTETIEKARVEARKMFR